ncbi:hypothetical protein ACFE04_003320 [Oxalis oulophora]
MEADKDDVIHNTTEPPLDVMIEEEKKDDEDESKNQTDLERSQLGESVESDTVGEVQPVVEEEAATVPAEDVSDRGEDVIAGGCEVEAIVDELAPASRLSEDEESRQDEVVQSSENEGLIGSVENEVEPPLEIELPQVQPVVDVEKEETKETVDEPLDQHVAFAKDEVLNGVVEEKLEINREELLIAENDDAGENLEMVEEMLIPDVTLELKTEGVMDEDENLVSSVVENMPAHENEELVDEKPVVPVIGGESGVENMAEQVDKMEASNEVKEVACLADEEKEMPVVGIDKKVDVPGEKLESEEQNVTEGEKMEVSNEAKDMTCLANDEKEMSVVDVERKVDEQGEEKLESEEPNVAEGDMNMEDSEMATMEVGVNDMEKSVEKGSENDMDIADVPEEEDIGDASENEMAEVDEKMDDKSDKEEEPEHEMADVAEDADMAVEETEAAEETEESKSASGKRKRGKNSKSPAKVPVKRKTEEDVCFICFDGGDLVLCDRRGCPKAYHPACVNRDEAFFQTKGKWNCGWHQCNNCSKNAYYTCYTCTFSLCKACTKDAVILCVRGNKGFCETCMRTVTLIENNKEGNTEMAKADFDKSSWEYLFKDYWIDLKARLSLTLEELSQAKNPRKVSDTHAAKQGSPDELYDANNDGGSGSDGSDNNNSGTPVRKKRKSKRILKSRSSYRTAATSADRNADWASQELLEFVMHMKKGDKSALSQFEIQALLLEYIKINKLRDPRRKSQIVCDARLQNIFGKPRVGHFEMLKLLESHFLLKEDSQVDDNQESAVDTVTNQSEGDGSADVSNKASKEKKRKTRKKGERGLHANIDDYAAIDKHNISLVYLKRNLVEDLLEDTETFQERVVGAFVRIRISGNVQKQDLYRLVQVAGTSKAGEPYKVGKKTTDFLLEILNLNKTEVVSIDIISNQDFTDDECKRLRQSIKCGLINRLTVGDIQEKAIELQASRVKDIGHSLTLITLRECVEKLDLLKLPEERQRRLEEIPEIHADPKMDPSYESDEDEGETDDKKQESYLRPRGSAFNRKVREPISPRKGSFASNDSSWAGTRSYSGMNSEFNRKSLNKGFSNIGDDIDVSLGQGRDKDMQVLSQSSSKTSLEKTSPGPSSTNSAPQVDESEKIWHYKDPSEKVQGPFSIVQLRKWNSTGYFPIDLKIWRTTQKPDDSIILTDALAGKFPKDPSLADNISTNTPMMSESRKFQAEVGKPSLSSIEIPKISTNRWGSETSLPSPTPQQRGGAIGQSFENWSPTPGQSDGPPSKLTHQHVSHLASPTPKVEMGHEKHSQVTASDVNAAAMNLGVDVKNVGAILQNLVQSTSGHVSKQDMIAQSHLLGNNGSQMQNYSMPVQTATGHWANNAPPSAHNPNLAWNAVNLGVAYPAPVTSALPPSDPWRPQAQPQSNIRPPAAAPTASNLPWGAGPTDNQGSAGLRQGWSGPVSGNTNANWAPPSQPQIPTNANPGWAPPQGPVNTPTNWAPPGPGNNMTNWAPPAPNQGQGQGSSNPSWSQVGQGPQPGNPNQSWGTQSPAKHSMWGNNSNNNNNQTQNQNQNQNQNHNGDRYSGHRERSSHGGDSGYRRQSSMGGGGGGSSRGPPYKGQRMCVYYEKGHCKKGSACDYLHS